MISFQELKDIENNALQTLRTTGALARIEGLQTSAHAAQIVVKNKEPINVNLSFSLPTRLREDSGRKAVQRPFFVGCFAAPKQGTDEISHLSYSVLIGKNEVASKQVARKFHFDYEPVSSRNHDEPKPSYHLQICGKLSAFHQDAGYQEQDIEHMLPSWSQPRIPSQPVSLALILNWLFLEFGNDPAVKTASGSETWQTLVRKAERSVLRPYYQQCAEFLARADNDKKSFVSRHLYAEP